MAKSSFEIEMDRQDAERAAAQKALDALTKPAKTSPSPAAAGPDASGGTGSGKPVPDNVPGGQGGQPQPQGSFWSLSGPGWSGPQQVSDWTTVAGSNIPIQSALGRATGYDSPADLVRLRQQVDAARQRLGPAGAASADFAGSMPYQAANAIPFGIGKVAGPGIAGGAQQGLMSYARGDPLSTVGEEAAKGAVLGEGSLIGGKLASPKALGQLTEYGVPAGLTALLGHHASSLLGVGGGEGVGAGGGALAQAFWGSESPFRQMGQAVERGAENYLGPRAQQAFQALLYGGGMAGQSALDAMTRAGQQPDFNNWQ